MKKSGFNRTVVLLLISFITSFIASGQDRINPRTLKEKCKSLTIRIYCNIENYDKPGIWRKCYYDDCDSLFFDQEGNVLKSFSFDENWKIRKAEFEYDNLSNRISSKSYDSSGKLLNHTKFKYKYDHKGHAIETHWTETGSAIVNNYKEYRTASKYDEKGNETELCFIEPKSKLTSTIAYKYNENNQLMEENSITSGYGNVSSHKEVYGYDERGNRNLWEHYFKGKLYSVIKQKYDDKNNLIEYVDYQIGKDKLEFSSNTTFKYDNYGNQIEVNSFNEKRELLSSVTYIYQYDQKGNWTECVSYDTRNIPGQKIVRKIEYY